MSRGVGEGLNPAGLFFARAGSMAASGLLFFHPVELGLHLDGGFGRLYLFHLGLRLGYFTGVQKGFRLLPAVGKGSPQFFDFSHLFCSPFG